METFYALVENEPALLIIGLCRWWNVWSYLLQSKDCDEENVSQMGKIEWLQELNRYNLDLKVILLLSSCEMSHWI